MKNEKAKELKLLLQQAERCIRPPSSFCEKAHEYIIEALAAMDVCKTCGGSEEKWDMQEIGGIERGDKIPCPACSNPALPSGEFVKTARKFAKDAANDFTYGRLKEGRHTQDYVKSIGIIQELCKRIEQLESEIAKKDELLFAYESVHAPVNPLLAENKRLRERIKELEQAEKGE